MTKDTLFFYTQLFCISPNILAFQYLEGGLVILNPNLKPTQKSKAQETLNLLGLDEYAGNPQCHRNDTRWKHRRNTWEKAD